MLFGDEWDARLVGKGRDVDQLHIGPEQPGGDQQQGRQSLSGRQTKHSPTRYAFATFHRRPLHGYGR